MEINEDKRKYNVWFDEIFIGKQEIRKVGNSYVITIPKAVMVGNGLSKGDIVIPIILLRKRRLIGELEIGCEWVQMTRKDRIRFKNYLKERDELERVALKK